MTMSLLQLRALPALGTAAWVVAAAALAGCGSPPTAPAPAPAPGIPSTAAVGPALPAPASPAAAPAPRIAPPPPGTVMSSASLCESTSAQPASPRAMTFAAIAQQQFVAFGNQTMDAQGRLTQSGSAEGEDFRTAADGIAPWERVMAYWRAVDPEARLPDAVRHGALRPASRQFLEGALGQVSVERLQGMGNGLGEGLRAVDIQVATAAIDRAAVIDTPWSAAFISWLAQQTGLRADEFTFSEAHADYAASAWAASRAEAGGVPTTSALRACDLVRTPPRVGDLLCQARGDDTAPDSFSAIGNALMARRAGGAAVPMHCDVVVAVDERQFDAIGGNVLQSVTQRSFEFAPGTRVLDPSYYIGCDGRTATCVDRHMSLQPWSLLLQWR